MDEASRSVRASSSSIQTILHGYITANRSTASAHRHTHSPFTVITFKKKKKRKKKKKDQIPSKGLIIISIIVLVLPRLSGVGIKCAQKNRYI